MEACYETKTSYLDMASDGEFPCGDENISVTKTFTSLKL
jgi:hypothetical protein